MLCSDTGKTEVVRLPHLLLDEAKALNAAKGHIIETSTEGELQITVSVKHRRFTRIRWFADLLLPYVKP